MNIERRVYSFLNKKESKEIADKWLYNLTYHRFRTPKDWRNIGDAINSFSWGGDKIKHIHRGWGDLHDKYRYDDIPKSPIEQTYII